MKNGTQKVVIYEQNIPEAQQNLVMERFEETRRNPYILLDWDDAKKEQED